MPDREEDKARVGRRASHEAIALAMQGRWQEAVAVNQNIIERFPTDIDAYNRLGKAFMESGEFARAREAYSRVLELDPVNVIARKNLDRLSLLPESHVPVKEERRKASPDLFIGEMGKAGVVTLWNLAPQEVLAKMVAGDQVYLKVQGQRLVVENGGGEYLGQVEPQRGFRLAKLMEGGNEYTAAIVRLGNDTAKVIIREVSQHPSQAGRLSFPVKAVEGFHPHVRDTLLRHGAVEESLEEVVEDLELEEGELVPEGFSIFEGDTSVVEEEAMTGEEFKEEE